MSCTRQLVEKSRKYCKFNIAADRQNTLGDIQVVRDSFQSVQAEQKKIALMLEKVVAGGSVNGPESRKQKVNREVSVSTYIIYFQ